MRNSTLSGNSVVETWISYSGGGAIDSFGPLRLEYSTLVNNSATPSTESSGIWMRGSPLHLRGSIVANNDGTHNFLFEEVTLASEGYNLSNDWNGLPIVLTDVTSDPALGDLANNGDETWSHALVHGPNGWQCNDNTTGVNPAIQGSFPAGTYRVWVASTAAGAYHRYQFNVRRQGQAVRPAVVAPQQPIAVALADRHGSVTVGVGFSPDPQTASGMAGGGVYAAEMGGAATSQCTGYVERTPNHILTLQSSFRYLRVDAQSNADTTLLIEGPNGWVCNDDTIGFNPRVEGSLPAGTYRIWVGNYYPNQTAPYTLSVSSRPGY